MNSTFLTNTIWYVLLGIVTIIEFTFVIYQSKRPKLSIAFFFTLMGITLHFEDIVLIFTRGYYYYPYIIKNGATPFDDALAGNLFSQASVSTTVLLVVILKLKSYWFFIIALIYAIVEELFIALGVYSQNWYQTWMTVVLLPLAFWIAKKMYAKIVIGANRIIYVSYIYLALFPLHLIVVIWGFMLSGHLEFSRTVLHDPINSRYFMVLVLFTILSIAVLFIYFSKCTWVWKFLTILILYILYYLGLRLHLLWIKEGWFWLVTTATILWMYICIFIMDKLYSGQIEKIQ